MSAVQRVQNHRPGLREALNAPGGVGGAGGGKLDGLPASQLLLMAAVELIGGRAVAEDLPDGRGL